MASLTSPTAIVLLSLHPQYVDAILRGDKKVEFRRRGFRRDVSHVVMYSTTPVGRIMGVFAVDGVEQGPPRELWAHHRDVAGLSERSFYEYYRGARSGVAIRIGSAQPLDTPLDLQQLNGDFSAPQSFRYLQPRDLPNALRSMLASTSA